MYVSMCGLRMNGKLDWVCVFFVLLRNGGVYMGVVYVFGKEEEIGL